MSGSDHARSALLFLLLGWVGCGDQLVEFPLRAPSSPTVIATLPLAEATSVSADRTISAGFSEAMSAASIDVSSFTVTQGATPVTGVVSLDVAGRVASFDPVALLTAGARYTATLTTAAKSMQGTGLAADYRWSFTLSHFDVVERSASAERVAAPDYELDTTAIMLLTDANRIVQSVSGSAELFPGAISGQRWALVHASGLDTYATLHAAFSAAGMPITLSIPAASFALTDENLTVPQKRTLIIANIVDGVPSYQAFEITFRSGR